MEKGIILIIILITISSCKKQTGASITEQFIVDVFNEQIKPETIVKNYIEINLDIETTIPLAERKLGYIQLVEETRSGKGVDDLYAYPHYSLKNIQSPVAYKYENHKHLNTIDCSNFDTIKGKIYVVLNPDKTKIITYILLNEVEDKIVSFSVLAKDNVAYFVQL